MSGFTKLFASIVDSTIWREDPHTKVVWVTMLAKSDKHGNVMMSLPGLADAARVTLDQCKAALAIFMAPDEYSRTKDFEGRRVMETDGGWILLNYTKYRKVQDEDQKRIATAERVRKFRGKHVRVTEPVMDVTQVTPSNAIAEAEAEAGKNTECPKPAKAASRPVDESRVLMTLPCVGKGPKAWPLTETVLSGWNEAFPGVDTLGEARKMKLWLDASPSKQKTFSGMTRFALAWLSRQQNQPHPQGASNGTNKQHIRSGIDADAIRQLRERDAIRAANPQPDLEPDDEVLNLFQHQ
jgi:hypothetical protein